MVSSTKSPQASLLDPLGSSPSLVLLEYDLGSPYAPILRQIVQDMLASQIQVIFVSVLLPTEQYLGSLDSELLHTLDYTSVVPGYTEAPEVNVLSDVSAQLSLFPKGPVALVVDCVDTMLADCGSNADTVNLLSRLFGYVAHHSSSSTVILPIRSQSPIRSALVSTSFRARYSSLAPPVHSLIHLALHPLVLLSHLVKQYHLSLPPADTPPEPSTSRFWSVFAPVARRGTGELLVMAAGTDELGEPGNRDQNTGFVELKTRLRTGGQKGVRTVLRGWRYDHVIGRIAWCGWSDIPALQTHVAQIAADTANTSAAMGDVSFNLQLSDAQQQARANVPLPYTNEGKASEGEIIYIPDQADDFDDDDPDDDLYI